MRDLGCDQRETSARLSALAGGTTTSATPEKQLAAERVRFVPTGAHSFQRHPGGRMDQLSADGTARDSVRARRRQLRAHARAQRRTADAVPDRFQTPQWLERSFVLPLNDGEVTVVPSQPQPHHDDFPEAPVGKRRGPAEAEPGQRRRSCAHRARRSTSPG